MEHTPSVRSTSAGRPAMSVRAMPIVPSSRATLRNPVSIPPMEPPAKNRPREKRWSILPAFLIIFANKKVQLIF